MGQRGPRPLPANVHRLRDNASHKPLAQLLDDTLRPDVEIPDRPAHLKGEAADEWDRIAPHLEALGLVSQLDRAMLTAYCDAWGEYVWACREIERANAAVRAEGIKRDNTGQRGRIGTTPSGYQQISVLVQIKNRALEQVHKFAAEFGMSPAARTRVTRSDPQLTLPGVEPKPQEGGWAAFPNKA